MLTVDFERLGVGPGTEVLDAGCGEGRHTLEVLRRGGRAVAMDLDPRDLAHTRYLIATVARERDFPPPASLALRGDAQRLPFPDARFDRVICSEVLEHVRDPYRAARELARVLRPGGVLAVSVPTPATEWAFRFASDDYFNTPGGHVRVFTPHRLARLMKRVGLEVADIHFAHAFHSLYWWVRAVCGLHDERHPAIRAFRRALTYALYSPGLTRAERALDRAIPKAMVLYLEKPAAPTPAAAADRGES